MLLGIIRFIIEVTILSVAIYYIIKFIRGTRGVKAISVFFTALVVVSLLSYFVSLQVLTWLLGWVVFYSIVSVLVLFQPEIRRMVMQLNTNPMLMTAREQRENIEVVVQSAKRMSETRTGALIALERGVNLQGFVENGVLVDCNATPEMFETVFFTNNAIHDGGVIMKGARILWAACVFPLSQSSDLSKSTGMRHRAALGMSEQTDAVVVVVSEESGYISYAFDGKLTRNVSEDDLRAFLTSVFVPKIEKQQDKRLRRWMARFRLWCRSKHKK